MAQPKELLYGMRMQRWVEVLDPHAPELRIAARSQHIRRRRKLESRRVVAVVSKNTNELKIGALGRFG